MSISTGLAGPMFLVFLVLKLTGTIDWSWWYITAPLWAPAFFLLGFWSASTLVSAALEAITRRKPKQARA